MRYKQLPAAPTSTPEPSPTARHLPSATAMLERAAAAAGLNRGGFVDDARRAATPHTVHCHGLSRENFSDEPWRFERELTDRREWCDENADLYEIEALRNEKTNVPQGYRFRFANLTVAVFFKMRFDTNL